MGRHSSSSQWAFYRSVAAWAMPWVLVAALLGVGIWITIDAIGNDDLVTPTVAGATSSPTPTPEPKPSRSATPEPEETPEDTPTEKASEEPEAELITEDMSVQVLNGTSDAAADDDMANQLTELGFEVIAINAANKGYEATTVFWSYAESQEAAERLAARFGWAVAAKPENLSTTVAIHVVVGADYVAQ